ncbi:unnamed protein product [Gulo gulo]|uniref:Uncharacterized protein n=1 Tax=Gulo gulo TaxID=48420 RepID=A0A9X9LP71_GULGU|nr:unnamed protein product [Gulo gulo]
MVRHQQITKCLLWEVLEVLERRGGHGSHRPHLTELCPSAKTH